MVMLCDQEGCERFFNEKEDTFNAAAAYKFTVPVFGPDVVYDGPHELLAQQKKFVKDRFTTESFKKYIDIIVKEVDEYFDANWGESGEKCIFEALSQVTVLTSVACLQGPEVRERFNKGFADVFSDLDAAFSPVGFFYPNAPLPAMRKRDGAREKLYSLYRDILNNRRDLHGKVEYHDVVDILLNSEYKDGQKLTNEHVVGIIIGLMIGGQHTSNVTTSWMLTELASNKDAMKEIVKEQKEILDNGPLTFEKLSAMKYLDYSMRETLRMHPPLIQLMRKVLEDTTYKNFVIKKGSFVTVSPKLIMELPDLWQNPRKFDPSRFSEDKKRRQKK